MSCFIENLNRQGCRIRQPIDKKKKKKTLTDRGTLLCVLKYFKSNETCLLSNFFKKEIVPCSMVKFSMPVILDRILHLASQTMYFRVSYFFKVTVTRHPKYFKIL